MPLRSVLPLLLPLVTLAACGGGDGEPAAPDAARPENRSCDYTEAHEWNVAKPPQTEVVPNYTASTELFAICGAITPRAPVANVIDGDEFEIPKFGEIDVDMFMPPDHGLDTFDVVVGFDLDNYFLLVRAFDQQTPAAALPYKIVVRSQL